MKKHIIAILAGVFIFSSTGLVYAAPDSNTSLEKRESRDKGFPLLCYSRQVNYNMIFM